MDVARTQRTGRATSCVVEFATVTNTLQLVALRKVQAKVVGPVPHRCHSRVLPSSQIPHGELARPVRQDTRAAAYRPRPGPRVKAYWPTLAMLPRLPHARRGQPTISSSSRLGRHMRHFRNLNLQQTSQRLPHRTPGSHKTLGEDTSPSGHEREPRDQSATPRGQR